MKNDSTKQKLNQENFETLQKFEDDGFSEEYLKCFFEVLYTSGSAKANIFSGY